MKTTPFYEAARRFAEGEFRFKSKASFEYDNRDKYGACEVLFYNGYSDDLKPSGLLKHREFFEKYFQPKEWERVAQNCRYYMWLTSQDRTWKQNRQDRIIALLFADLMWRDEHE